MDIRGAKVTLAKTIGELRRKGTAGITFAGHVFSWNAKLGENRRRQWSLTKANVQKKQKPTKNNTIRATFVTSLSSSIVKTDTLCWSHCCVTENYPKRFFTKCRQIRTNYLRNKVLRTATSKRLHDCKTTCEKATVSTQPSKLFHNAGRQIMSIKVRGCPSERDALRHAKTFLLH